MPPCLFQPRPPASSPFCSPHSTDERLKGCPRFATCPWSHPSPRIRMGTPGGQGAVCPAGHAPPGPGKALELWARRFLPLVTSGQPPSEPRSGPRASLRCGHRGPAACHLPRSLVQVRTGPLPQALTSLCQHVRDPFPNPQGPGVSFPCGGGTTLLSSPLPWELCSSGHQARGRQAKGLGVRAGPGCSSGLGPGACLGARLGTRATEGGYVCRAQWQDSRPAPNVGWDFFGNRTFQT